MATIRVNEKNCNKFFNAHNIKFSADIDYFTCKQSIENLKKMHPFCRQFPFKVLATSTQQVMVMTSGALEGRVRGVA